MLDAIADGNQSTLERPLNGKPAAASFELTWSFSGCCMFGSVLSSTMIAGTEQV